MEDSLASSDAELAEALWGDLQNDLQPPGCTAKEILEEKNGKDGVARGLADLKDNIKGVVDYNFRIDKASKAPAGGIRVCDDFVESQSQTPYLSVSRFLYDVREAGIPFLIDNPQDGKLAKGYKLLNLMRLNRQENDDLPDFTQEQSLLIQKHAERLFPQINENQVVNIDPKFSPSDEVSPYLPQVTLPFANSDTGYLSITPTNSGWFIQALSRRLKRLRYRLNKEKRSQLPFYFNPSHKECALKIGGSNAQNKTLFNGNISQAFVFSGPSEKNPKRNAFRLQKKGPQFRIPGYLRQRIDRSMAQIKQSDTWSLRDRKTIESMASGLVQAANQQRSRYCKIVQEEGFTASDLPCCERTQVLRAWVFPEERENDWYDAMADQMLSQINHFLKKGLTAKVPGVLASSCLERLASEISKELYRHG